VFSKENVSGAGRFNLEFADFDKSVINSRKSCLTGSSKSLQIDVLEENLWR
jgi:hypothetical protein